MLLIITFAINIIITIAIKVRVIRKKYKRGGSMVQGQVFLKAGGQYLIFSKFIIILIPAKIVLYIYLKTNYFFSANIILWKNIILSYLKMNVCECVWKTGVSKQGTSSVLCMKVGKMFWNTLKGGGIEKMGVETKI